MKYIVITASKISKKPGGDTSIMRFPFIFPNMLVHSHVAKVTSLLISLMYPQYQTNITSAGEINSMDFTGNCFGESTTLNVKAAEGDTQLVRMSDYGANLMEI